MRNRSPTETSRKDVSIILAEDDDELRFILARMLTMEGYDVEEVSDVDSLARRLADLKTQVDGMSPVRAVVSDNFLTGGTALEVLESFEGGRNALPVILITSVYDPEVVEKAKRLDVRAVLTKPVEMTELIRRLEECLADE